MQLFTVAHFLDRVNVGEGNIGGQCFLRDVVSSELQPNCGPRHINLNSLAVWMTCENVPWTAELVS